ncbi:MAG: AraC family transcriptional regulator [Leadbetterella sp.]|nr:AraC family transcriptional regulator [Leadbetterella sp.]
MGIQQFYRDSDFSSYFSDYPFFSGEELEPLFGTWETGLLTSLLDAYLFLRYREFHAPVVSRILESILGHPEEFSMEALSSRLGISRRHISRVFKACIGVPPKRFHEIVLFRKILDQKLYKKPAEKFSALAYDAGLSDQAHLIKVFRKLTGHNPRSFVSKGTYLGQEDTFWHLLT